ncbi:MAG TPA: hypothetical protein VFP71_11085, partial [Candidatus Angelobacter sp.]|nr:hypothetical protein [Candidatus Angelobacter sp.]
MHPQKWACGFVSSSCGDIIEGMSLPYTPPPRTLTYRVRINLGEWTEYQTPVKASKFVADNIYTGRDVEVMFVNAVNPQTVLSNFNKRIDEWLRQLGHKGSFSCEPNQSGAY